MLFQLRKLRPVRAIIGSTFIAVVGTAPASAVAQETRTEEITKKQEEKAAKSQPYKPNRYEEIMNRLEETFASPPSGFFPDFGSVYPGGGFTLGAGYRHFYAREAVWEIKGLYSIKNYKLIEVGTRTPWTSDGRLVAGTRAGWRDATQVGFYGLGMDTSTDDRGNARIQQTFLEGSFAFRPNWWTRLEGEVAYWDFTTKEGQGSAPSIETIYNSTTAPGLLSKPNYIVSVGTAAIDWRPSPGYARNGGYYGVTFRDQSDIDKTFSFQQVNGEIIQHVPILRAAWVISLHGRVQSVLGDDSVVPYYLLPYLGSGRTLRAYPTGRFRDRNALLTTVELRWIPSALALDMAVFYDAGKVANSFDQLDFNGMKSDWGIGVRFHGPAVTPLRIEVARGSEGWHLVVSTSAPF